MPIEVVCSLILSTDCESLLTCRVFTGRRGREFDYCVTLTFRLS